ncbi:flavodoxin reductase [Thalassococcus sp. CAU 1522]|uniref:Flavodoxin reductase n=2 Tax=Thalassococcus arenae TaxID=2851652 RepID=A0ABS6N2Z4_9RHOB|nr:flavodoxin reductase [Thalassococcus arenae]MBV2358387.1 flavodoxin reductase [Thalassococcus arenae]
MTHALILLDTVTLTPDTRHYVCSKPDGYAFQPGQATELSLERDGWREEKRPFTFTSDPDADVLSFTIKSYRDRDGVTAELWHAQPGDRFLIGDAWGAIEDKGPGVFVAGGAGITPFIPILAARARSGTLDGCRLIYSNRTAADIILRPFWESLDGLQVQFVVTDEDNAPFADRIDAEMLDTAVGKAAAPVYLCGPPAMEDAISEMLTGIGVDPERILREGDG